jgi:hypothetical protein
MASVHQNGAPANGTVPGSAPVVFPACVAALYPHADAPAPPDPDSAIRNPQSEMDGWPEFPDPEVDGYTWELGPDPDETCDCNDPECRLCADRNAEVLWGCIVSEEIDPSAPGAVDRGPSPDAPRLAGYQVVAMEAERYRTFGTPIGDLIAATLDDLAHEWRFLGGQSVDQFLDRRLQMELWYSRREAEALIEQGVAW